MTAGGGGRAARRLSCEPRCSVFDAPEIQYMYIHALCGVRRSLSGRARAGRRREDAPRPAQTCTSPRAPSPRAHTHVAHRSMAYGFVHAPRLLACCRLYESDFGHVSALGLAPPGSAPFKRTARQPRNGYTARMHPGTRRSVPASGEGYAGAGRPAPPPAGASAISKHKSRLREILVGDIGCSAI